MLFEKLHYVMDQNKVLHNKRKKKKVNKLIPPHVDHI